MVYFRIELFAGLTENTYDNDKFLQIHFKFFSKKKLIILKWSIFDFVNVRRNAPYLSQKLSKGGASERSLAAGDRQSDSLSDHETNQLFF